MVAVTVVVAIWVLIVAPLIASGVRAADKKALANASRRKFQLERFRATQELINKVDRQLALSEERIKAMKTT